MLGIFFFPKVKNQQGLGSGETVEEQQGGQAAGLGVGQGAWLKDVPR